MKYCTSLRISSRANCGIDEADGSRSLCAGVARRLAERFRQSASWTRTYVDHWSFWLDVKVIAKTIPAVLKGVGAA